MIRCVRPHCGGALRTDSTDPESELLRCNLCTRAFAVVFGEAVEMTPQVGTKADDGKDGQHRDKYSPRKSHANPHPNWLRGPGRPPIYR